MYQTNCTSAFEAEHFSNFIPRLSSSSTKVDQSSITCACRKNLYVKAGNTFCKLWTCYSKFDEYKEQELYSFVIQDNLCMHLLYWLPRRKKIAVVSKFYSKCALCTSSVISPIQQAMCMQWICLQILFQSWANFFLLWVETFELHTFFSYTNQKLRVRALFLFTSMQQSIVQKIYGIA